MKLAPPVKRLGVGVAILAVGLVSSFTFQWLRSRAEPKFQGYPISRWILELGNASANPGETFGPAETRRAIRTIGTNAIPYLIRAVEASPGVLDSAMYARGYALMPLGLQHLLPQPRRRLWARPRAALLIAVIGGGLTGPARETMLVCLQNATQSDDPELRSNATRALAMMTNAIPASVNHSSDKQP